MTMPSSMARRLSSVALRPCGPLDPIGRAAEARRFCPAGEMFFQGFAHRFPADLVGAVQFVDQGIVVAEGEKQGDDALVVAGGMAKHQPAQRAQFAISGGGPTTKPMRRPGISDFDRLPI